MLYTEFQRMKRSRRWIFSEVVCIFFVHSHASESKGATPFVLPNTAYLYVLECVHSNHASRSRKYQPHAALRQMQKNIRKSRFLGPLEIRRSIGSFPASLDLPPKLWNYACTCALNSNPRKQGKKMLIGWGGANRDSHRASLFLHAGSLYIYYYLLILWTLSSRKSWL